MTNIPKQLSAFSTTLNMFQSAAAFGRMETAFDSIAARLDYVAQRINAQATACGHQDIDDTGIAVTFGGEASAFGEDTYARGLTLGKTVDLGLVSYALGTVTFTAAAQTTGEETAVALTSSFATVSGADIVIVFTKHSAMPLTPGANEAYSTSTTSFIAIDLEFWDSASGPIYIENGVEGLINNMPIEIEGNLSVLNSVLSVLGEETYVSEESQVLSIENTLSSVTAVNTLALGA